MRKKLVIIGFALTILLLGAFFLFGGKSSNTGTDKTSTGSPSPNTESASASIKEFSSTEVALHNKATDCWTIISGSVYDITSYVPKHPGGDDILRACGTDGTTLFTQRTTTDGQKIGSGTPHDSSAESQLSSLKIGILAK